jgi:hypothetical protein
LLAKTILENRWIINLRGDLFDFGLLQLTPQKIVRGYRRLRPRSLEAFTFGIHSDLLTRSDASEHLSRDNGRARFPAPGQWHRYRSLTLSIFNHGVVATRHLYNGHGIELAQPYCDRRLVEFVMAVPAEVLGRPDYDIRLHRHAMRSLSSEAVRK